MFWWILLIILFGALIFSIRLYLVRKKEYSNSHEDILLAVLLLGVVSVCLGVGIVFAQISTNANIALFIHQKEYLERYDTNNTLEDAVIVEKKIEYNKWLFEAQYEKDKYGFFSLYPDGIKYLEKIE